MCGGLAFKAPNNESLVTVYFPRPYATIYGINEKQQLIQAYWGKRWGFILKEDEFIEGILIRKENFNFIYVVTVPSIGEYVRIHERWVLIKNCNKYEKIVNLSN